MRKRFEIQLEIGSRPIEEIGIPLKSRDELPPVLRALQYIYTTPEINEQVFDLLESEIVITGKGRPGMSLWEILVFGVVRLTLDADYDRLEHIANYDMLVRELLGLSDFGRNKKLYPLQTLKDNVGFLSEELLDEINGIVVKVGHRIKKKDEALRVKIDTYPVESNVHFPTDVNLLWDAARKSVQMVLKIVVGTDIPGWRKGQAWIREIKNAYLRVNKRMAKGGKNKAARLHELTKEYLRLTNNISKKIKSSKEALVKATEGSLPKTICLMELFYFEEMLDKHIDLVERRIVKGEKIPHNEKMFSLFEPYTEWIKKGKSGNRVDLGLNVAVATDQYGFCVHHHVLEEEQDVDIAVPMTGQIIELSDIPIGSVSYDKGCWSKDNYEKLSSIVPEVIMRKKGKSTQQEYEREHENRFIALCHEHSAVESDINSLEHHGLDRCPDSGIDHFKRYISLGILSYNFHRLGNLLIEEDRKKIKKCRPARLRHSGGRLRLALA
ncbi:MAG: ISNCY family transposase [Candidatus Marinimicrobia bacterium]|nr:ISNCY family transposase [Candidatus Neomarinimicrobiota bacterium]